MSRFLIVMALLAATPALGKVESGEAIAINPMRKVITMLQMMSKKVEAEGEKQAKIFEAYMCWCETGESDLSYAIDAATTKIPQLESSIEETTSTLAGTKQSLADAKASRESAKAAMAKATAQRASEYEIFTKESGDDKTNLAAMSKAIAAIEKGMGGSFLQTETQSAAVLRKLVVDSESLSDLDRDVVASFLSTDSTQHSSDSGQILGILKQMQDTMDAAAKETIAKEAAAKKTFDELMAAKTKEVEQLTISIEEFTVRIGDLGVSLAEMKEDLEDTMKMLTDDQKFLVDMQKSCTEQKDGWAFIEKMRQEELVALADTIKILNDDDALELFKKTLASGSSFLQELVTADSMRSKALVLLQDTRHSQKASSRIPLELITMALMGKKVSFDKVLKMIDELVDVLGKEQEGDDTKKEYCEEQIDKLEDTKKEIKHAIGDLDALIEDLQESIATTTDELKALAKGIEKLDKDVLEATDVRKEENSDFKTSMAANTAAKDLIGVAKNRMQKFYNPSLYKAPPKRVLTEEERITLNMGGTLAPTAAPGGIAGTGVGFVQIRMHSQGEDEAAPPPPPGALPAYSKKSEESGGVLAMMDMMVADVEKEMQTAEVEEKNAQEEYEQFMADSADKRALDSKTITDKEAAKAQMETDLAKGMSDLESKTGELMSTEEALAGTHAECDWLMENYESRKAAREGEVESLKKAKSILSGADFSLLQSRANRRTLRGRK